MLNQNTQIEAYLDKDRGLKEMEKFLIKILSDRFFDSCETDLYVKDLGCGDGLLLHTLAQKFKKINFHGLDISERLIDIANSRPSLSNLNYSVGDCRNPSNDLPDIIIASGILSIFDDWETVMLSWLNSLKSKGRILLFGGFNPYNVDVKIKFRNNFSKSDWETGLDIISIDTLKSFLDQNSYNCFEFGKFTPSIEIPKSENPIRGFTVNATSGEKLIMNGALQVRCFYAFGIEKQVPC